MIVKTPILRPYNIQTAITNMTKQRMLFKTLINDSAFRKSLINVFCFLQHALFCHVYNRSLYIREFKKLLRRRRRQRRLKTEFIFYLRISRYS